MPETQNHYITANEVKRHHTRRSVWMVIHNEVYDVTSFVNEHPGGEDPLLDAAGLDATIAFYDVGHSEDALLMLKKYKIGTLAPGETCCPSTQILGAKYEKPWRTFDGMPSRRGGVCRPPPRPPSPPPPESSNRLKYAAVALAGALIIGLMYKKFIAAAV